MPGDPGVTVVTMLVFFFHFACEAAGALDARHSLRPLSSARDVQKQNSDASRRGIAESCFGKWGNVIARSESDCDYAAVGGFSECPRASEKVSNPLAVTPTQSLN